MEDFIEAITCLCEETIVLAGAPRAIVMKQLSSKVKSSLDDPKVRENAEGIVSVINSCVQRGLKKKTISFQREESSLAFQEAALTSLPPLWDRIFDFTLLQIESSDPIFSQSMNLRLFDAIFERQLRFRFGKEGDSASKACEREPNETERNILRYMCGYVPFSLRKKFSGSDVFVRCLDGMRLECEENALPDHSYSDPSTASSSAWLSRIWRGNLFEVNDAAFRFFLCLERQIANKLPAFLLKQTSSIRDFNAEVAQSSQLSQSWQPLSECVEDDFASHSLYEEVISLYVTIRGHAITASWLEQFQQERHCQIKAKKSLRKSVRVRDE